MGVADVWLVDGRAIGDDALAAFHHWLGADEAQRHARFVRPQRRRQFLIGRVLLRQALGRMLGVPAQSIALVERPGQAPALAIADSAGVGYSISHSGPWVACAVSGDTALGLDIELLDARRDLSALAGQAFDPDTNAWLAARPASSRVRDFYQLWSVHEARIKLGPPQAHVTELFHPDLSVALCSARPLSQQPMLALATLA